MSLPSIPAHLNVVLPDGTRVESAPHVPVSTFLPRRDCPETGLPYLGALVNNDVCSLAYPLCMNAQLSWLTIAERHGTRIYRRTLSFLLAKVVRDLFPDAQFAVEHSLGNAYYCSFERNGVPGMRGTELAELDRCLRELIEADLPIERRCVAYSEAVAYLRGQGLSDKLNLLQYRNPPMITLFQCAGFADAGFGVLAPSTGTVPMFRLLAYEPGFVLQFPVWNGKKLLLEPFARQPHLFEIFQEHKRWGRAIGVNTVGDLNAISARHEEKDLIRISETLHEKKLARIADRILEHHDRVKWILMAGPSSAGKTTTSKRLMVHLKVNGLRPVRLELDHYFCNRERTPRHPDGSYDFEHLRAIDLELLNDHLVRLDRGEEIALPTFDFREGKTLYLGNTLRLEEDQVVLIEGIHALNPALTDHLPGTHKFKIYLSALTQLKLDNHNRLSTTDLRLIRRTVRDATHRGHDAIATLRMWPSVRQGEKTWIFPHQQEADATFNSSLDYELAVLKPFIEPLLHAVKPTDEVYGEARRLQDFLELIVAASAEHVPPHSLLREFIGGSIYQDDA